MLTGLSINPEAQKTRLKKLRTFCTIFLGINETKQFNRIKTEFFRFIDEDSPTSDEYNAPLSEKEEDIGKTPLWVFAKLVLIKQWGAYLFVTVLNKVSIKDLDFNVTAKNEHDGEKSPLLMLTIAACQGITEPLDRILNQENLDHLNFNIKCDYGNGHDVSVLNLLIDLISKSQPQYLQLVFTKVPLETLDFNSQFYINGKKDRSVLHQLIDIENKLFLQRQFYPFLKKLLRSAAINKLNFNLTIEGGPKKGETPLSAFINFVNIFERFELVEALFTKPSVIERLDFNVRCASLENENETILWRMALAASQGETRPILMLLSGNYDIGKLNFDAEPNCRNKKSNAQLLKCFDEKKTNIMSILKLYESRCPIKDRKELITLLNEDHGDINGGVSVLLLLIEAALNGYIEPLKQVIDKAPLANIDFRKKASKGRHQSYSALSRIGEISPRCSMPMMLILKKYDELKLSSSDFNEKISHGANKGTSIFWHIVLAACNDHILPLEEILKKIPIQEIDLNVRREYNNTTVFWLLTYLSLQNDNVISKNILRTILDTIPIEQIDISSAPTEKKFINITPLWCLAALAVNGTPEPLEMFFKKASTEILLSIDFNATIDYKEQQGKTLLFLISQAANIGNPFVLEKVLDVIPAKKLNFNAAISNGPDKGTSVLWNIACMAANGNTNILRKLFENVRLDKLNFGSMPESGINQNKSILWFLSLIAAKGCTEPLMLVLKKVPSNKLDFNTGAKNERFASPLAIIAYAAVRGNPEILEQILNDIPIQNLDFKNDDSNSQFETIVPEKMLGSRFMLFIAIKRYEASLFPSKSNKASVDESSLDEIEKLATKAFSNGHTDAYSYLALFYKNIKNMSRLKILVGKIREVNANGYELSCYYYARLIFNNSSYQKCYAIQHNIEPHDARKEIAIEALEYARLAKDFHNAGELISLIESSMQASISQNETQLEEATTCLQKLSLCNDQTGGASVHASSETQDANKMRFRSKSAQKLHVYIMKAIDSETESDFECHIKNIQITIYNNHQPDSILTAKSIHGYSHLYDILHLPFARKNDRDRAEKIAIRLWDVLVNLCSTRLERTSWHNLLLDKNNYGFNLLHQAVNSGSKVIIDKFVSTIQSTFNENAAHILSQLSSDSDKFFQGKVWKSCDDETKTYIACIIEPYLSSSSLPAQNDDPINNIISTNTSSQIQRNIVLNQTILNQSLMETNVEKEEINNLKDDAKAPLAYNYNKQQKNEKTEVKSQKRRKGKKH